MWVCQRLLVAGVWNLILALVTSTTLVGRLRGSVELPCKLKSLNRSIEKLMVYWQVKEAFLVASVQDGEVNMDNQHEKYTGRAYLNPRGLKDGNFTLHLSNLSLADSGPYDCIIMWAPTVTMVLHRSTINLEVTAEFNTPVVECPNPGPVMKGQELTLTCMTQGGLQQPRIFWINSSDNMILQGGRIHNDIQHTGDFINVTSKITINITSPINISCIALTGDRNLTSLSYYVELMPENIHEKQYGSSTVLSVTVTVITVFLLIGVFAALLKGTKLKCFSFPGNVQQINYHQGAGGEDDTNIKYIGQSDQLCGHHHRDTKSEGSET